MGLTLSYTPRGGFGLGLQKAWASEEEDDWWSGWDIDDWCDYIYWGGAAEDGIDGHIWNDYDSFIDYYGNDMAEIMTGMDLDYDGDIGVADTFAQIFFGSDGVPAGLTAEQEANWQMQFGAMYNVSSVYVNDGSFNLIGWLGALFGNIGKAIDKELIFDPFIYNKTQFMDWHPNYKSLKFLDYYTSGNDSGEGILQGFIDDLYNPDFTAEELREAYEEALAAIEEAINEASEIDGESYSSETGTAGYNSSTPTLPTTKPEVQTEKVDCTEEGNPNKEVKEINEKLFKHPTVEQVHNELRESVKTDIVEKGTVVDYDFYADLRGEEPYSFNKQWNVPTNPSIISSTSTNSINMGKYTSSTTVVDMHTHPCDESTTRSNIVIMAPSISDFIVSFYNAFTIDRIQSGDTNPAYQSNSDRTYKGSLVAACDGSEYFLYVADLDAVKTFFTDNGKNLDNIRTLVMGKAQFKSGTKLQIDYDKAFKEFSLPYFSQERQLYALTYALQQSNCGIKLMKKNAEGEFEEQAVKEEGEKLLPVTKKCP